MRDFLRFLDLPNTFPCDEGAPAHVRPETTTVTTEQVENPEEIELSLD
jgi:hypothetical protein